MQTLKQNQIIDAAEFARYTGAKAMKWVWTHGDLTIVLHEVGEQGYCWVLYFICEWKKGEFTVYRVVTTSSLRDAMLTAADQMYEDMHCGGEVGPLLPESMAEQAHDLTDSA